MYVEDNIFSSLIKVMIKSGHVLLLVIYAAAFAHVFCLLFGTSFIPSLIVVFIFSFLSVSLHEYAHVRSSYVAYGKENIDVRIKASILSIKVMVKTKREPLNRIYNGYILLAGPIFPILVMVPALMPMLLLAGGFIKHVIALAISQPIITNFASFVPISYGSFKPDMSRARALVLKETKGKNPPIITWLRLISGGVLIVFKRPSMRYIYSPRQS